MTTCKRSLVFLALLALAGASPVAGKDGAVLTASNAVAVVPTEAGKVQGFEREGIETFRGLPYATAQRFMPPAKVSAWANTRPTLSYGNVCPQPISPELREPQTFVADTRFWPASENCQNLNVWTPKAGDNKKRPVMVWLHGGGFFSGSSMELPIYDGANLSRKGDVVVVSVNHRLNALGFMDLSAYGEKYSQSANVGMLDIVAALDWVKANIAAFGGDPSNVTIFGQSGGGAKVSTLLAAASAKGRFHKAIVQSGAPGSMHNIYSDQKISKRVAELTLQNAGLSAATVDGLSTIPYDALIAAGDKALATVSQEAKSGTSIIGRPFVSWGPVTDGQFLSEAPFANSAPTVSKGIPLMIGSTMSEFMNFPNPKLRGRENWSEAEVMAYLRTEHGAKADAVIAAHRAAYPELPANLWPLVDTTFRGGVLRTARMKAEQGDPVYSYVFAWRSPVLDYAWAGGHSAELAFIFNNATLGVQSSGGGRVVDRLTAQMSQAWIDFARTGNPNRKGLPVWPKTTVTTHATMIFDERPDVRRDHDTALITLLSRGP